MKIFRIFSDFTYSRYMFIYLLNNRNKEQEDRNYRLHTVLVFQEDQGPWQMNHKCVEHMWLTGSEEYVVFIPSED